MKHRPSCVCALFFFRSSWIGWQFQVMSASTSQGRGRGRGRGRVSRTDAGAPEPYRSQSMTFGSEKPSVRNDQNALLPSLSTLPSVNERHSSPRARSTDLFANALHSNVPEAAILSIAKRPDHGGTGNHTDHLLHRILLFTSIQLVNGCH